MKNNNVVLSTRLFVLFVLFLLLALVIPLFSSAQTGGSTGAGGSTGSGGFLSDCLPGRPCLQNPLGQTTTIYALLESIISWLTRVGAAIAALMIVVGAFQMLFSGGDTEKFKRGRQTILYTAIGYGIIILAWSIAALIRNILQ